MTHDSVQIGDGVVNVFDPYAQAHGVRRDASRTLGFRGELRMRCGYRMNRQRFRIAHVGEVREQLERIERLLPGPYLEMFARQSRPGWDRWGNQEELFDQGPVATRRRPSRGA